jgi:sortase (surface protein transpeptidase)
VKGDKIYVEDENGTIFSFVVRESKIYDPAADAFAVFYSNDGKAHLNIATCEGTWIPAQKTFSNRLVVFTDKE